jgi:hypothetical protein
MKHNRTIIAIQKITGIVIMFFSLVTVHAQTTITNVATTKKLGLNGNQPAADNNLTNTAWILEPNGEGFTKIKNAATGGYLHNENGKLECGPLGLEGWWSAQWSLFTNQNGNKFIINRFKNNQLLHMNNGVLELSAVQTAGNLSTQWIVSSAGSGTVTSGTSPVITPVATSPQRTTQQADATTGQYISLDYMEPIRITNLILLDTVNGNNKAESHLAFDINISNDPSIIAHLKKLETATKNPGCDQQGGRLSQADFNLSVYDALNNADIEKREYEICVTNFTLGVLDASDKAGLNAHVEVVSYNSPKIKKENSLKVTSQSPLSKTYRAMVANFNIQLGSLDTRRVRSVNGLSINADNNKNVFSFDFGAGDKNSFSDFYQRNPREVIPSGKIVLLAPDLQKELLTIYLKNISPQFYKSQNSTQTTTGRMHTFGFKAASISFTE